MFYKDTTIIVRSTFLTLLFLFLLTIVNAQIQNSDPCPLDGPGNDILIEAGSKQFVDFAADFAVPFQIRGCPNGCTGCNGYIPPPHSVQIQSIIDPSGQPVGNTPIMLDSLTYPTDDADGVYNADWSQNLAPGTYMVTVGVRVCYTYNFEPDAAMSENIATCCSEDIVTFELCVVPTAVPTMSEWGLLIFGLSVLIMSLVLLYHKRYELGLSS